MHDGCFRLRVRVAFSQADDSLGELLRSGSLGDNLREKMKAKLTATIQKAANLGAALPPGFESVAAIRSLRFAGADGRLSLLLEGEVRMPAAKLRALLGQMNSEAAHAH